MRYLPLFLALLVVTTLPARAEVAVRRLDVTVDFSDAAEAGETLQALAADLATAVPVVYLDLAIVPDQDAKSQRWSYHLRGEDGAAIGCGSADDNIRRVVPASGVWTIPEPGSAP
jgi:hypothetical protein